MEVWHNTKWLLWVVWHYKMATTSKRAEKDTRTQNDVDVPPQAMKKKKGTHTSHCRVHSWREALWPDPGLIWAPSGSIGRLLKDNKCPMWQSIKHFSVEATLLELTVGPQVSDLKIYPWLWSKSTTSDLLICVNGAGSLTCLSLEVNVYLEGNGAFAHASPLMPTQGTAGKGRHQDCSHSFQEAGLFGAMCPLQWKRETF